MLLIACVIIRCALMALLIMVRIAFGDVAPWTSYTAIAGRDADPANSVMSLFAEEVGRSGFAIYFTLNVLLLICLFKDGDVCLVYCEHGYIPCNELLPIRRWARGRAEDHATLPADLEMRDLLTTTTSQSISSATESLRPQNEFEDVFDTERSQLIRIAEITLPFLVSCGHDDQLEDRYALHGLDSRIGHSRPTNGWWTGAAPDATKFLSTCRMRTCLSQSHMGMPCARISTLRSC